MRAMLCLMFSRIALVSICVPLDAMRVQNGGIHIDTGAATNCGPQESSHRAVRELSE